MASKKKIGFKITGMLILAMFISIVVIMGFILFQSYRTVKNLTSTLSDCLMTDYDELIKSEVETVITMLEPINEQIKSGTISETDGKKIAENIIREARYGIGGYFWTDTTEGVNVVLLGNKDVEGKDRTDLTDINGFKIVKRFLELGNGSEGKGFLDYYYFKENATVQSRKRAYVQLYKPFNWIIGTGNYVDDIEGLLSEKESQITDMGRKTMIYSIILSLVFLIIGFFVSKKLSNSIAKPIEILQKKIDNLADYNLESIVAGNSYIQKYISKNNDELSSCLKSTMAMNDNFVTLVKHISENAQDVTATSEELTAISQNTSQSAHEVSQAVENIAQGATNQAQDTQSAANNIQAIRDLIKDNANMVKELKKSVSVINEKKENGQALLTNMLCLVNDNQEAAKNINDVIISADRSADRISTASEMIQSISDQTNLLALNAAIEAARAGEAGKGFAVVAEEIKKLAEQSAGFTGEITSVISELKNRTQEAVNTMVSIGKMAESQNQQAKETQENFTQIAEAVEISENIIKEIDESSTRIDKNSKEIVSVIENLSAIAEENAATTEEASAGVSTQTQTINEIMQSSENLSKLAVSLQEEVARFKL